jgi:hypothetical protein
MLWLERAGPEWSWRLFYVGTRGSRGIAPRPDPIGARSAAQSKAACAMARGGTVSAAAGSATFMSNFGAVSL